MAIPTKKVKNEPEDNTVEKNARNETATSIVEAKDFPPPPDKNPDDNVADLSGDEELVGVKTIQDHTCNIGGRSYVFKAGERVMVPFNVKCILSRANLLRG